LESRTHEGVTRTGMGKDGKVNIEEREIDDERDKDETSCLCGKVFPEIILSYDKMMKNAFEGEILPYRGFLSYGRGYPTNQSRQRIQ